MTHKREQEELLKSKVVTGASVVPLIPDIDSDSIFGNITTVFRSKSFTLHGLASIFYLFNKLNGFKGIRCEVQRIF